MMLKKKDLLQLSLGGIILGAMVMLTSCLSTGAAVEAEGKEREVKRIEPVVLEGVMDFSKPEYAALWNISPVNGHPRFFSIVPRQAFRDEEYERCIDMAAVQASRYVASQVLARFATVTQGRAAGALEDVQVYFDTALANQLRQELEPVEYYQDREASYMVLEYKGANINPIRIDNTLQNGMPSWISAPPVVQGFLVGVGVTNRYRLVADSIYQADKMALGSIAQQLAVDLQAKQQIRDTGRGSAAREVTLETSDVVLRGAYIAARWRSADGNQYYSLALYPRY